MTWSKEMQEGFVLANTIQRERAGENVLQALIVSAQQGCAEIDSTVQALQGEEQEACFRQIAEKLKPRLQYATIDAMEPRARVWLARYVKRQQAARWLENAPEIRPGFQPAQTLPKFLSELAADQRLDPSAKEQRIALGRKLFQERVASRPPTAVPPIVAERTQNFSALQDSPSSFRDALAAEEQKKAKMNTAIMDSKISQTKLEPTPEEQSKLAQVPDSPVEDIDPEKAKEQRRNRMLVDAAMNMGDRAGFLQRLGALWLGWEDENESSTDSLERAGRELRSLWEFGCLE